jgi:hypothetical protein
MSDKKYPAMDSAQVRKVLEHVRAGEDFAMSDYVTFKDCSAEYRESFVKDLSSHLEAIRSRYPAEIPMRSPIGGEFEAEACSVVHSTMRTLPGEALDDPDFWKYLTVTHFRGLVEWRHGGAGRVANLANYGVSAERRNLLLRMFYRAEVAFEPTASDPYYLCRQGDEDLWKSHFGAVRVGNCPSIVKAFVTKVFPANGSPRLKTKQVRELAKNLTRLRSNIIFELYDFDASLKLIEREVQKLEVAKE